LTGRPPYIGDTPVSIAFQHVSGELIKPRTLNQNLPNGLDVILTVALAKKPEDRYQSAKEMLDDIRKLRTGQIVTTRVARKPIRWLPILVGALVAVLAGGVISYGVLNSSTTVSSTLVEIPNVVGLTQPEAQAMLNDFVITIQRAHDGRVPKDRVASQVPLPTSKVKKGSGVILTLSDGPGDAIIPTDLVGMSLADARISLAAAGLVISRTDPVPSDQPQGTILNVTPDAGSTISAGSGVVLQIASGDIEVPSLVGTDGIQALTVLIQAGFLVNQIQAYDANQPIGVVLAQAPAPGTTHTIGSSVTITVNRAP
ncbi:MAG: PASTA domain-containing protein, partial [Actinobacteria bacterium]|nr:PASTA domain-containing protein [Actinomycetota bacterium]